MSYYQNSNLYPLYSQYPRQNAQLNGLFDSIGDAFNDIGNSISDGLADLDPTNHDSWLGGELHNAADWLGDATGIHSEQFASLVSTGLNFLLPGVGSLVGSAWVGALQASAAEEQAGAISVQLNAQIEKAKTERIAGIETVANALAKEYPNSPELIPLYRQGATNALNALFSGDMQAKVNESSLKALDTIINGSLISTQKLAAQQKEFDILNPNTNGDTATGGTLSKDAKSGEEEKDNTLMYVGIGVSVLAVLATGTAIYMKNKKKKDA